MTNVSATVSEYGDFVKVSRFVSSTALDPELKEKVPIIGTQMAETLDRLTGDEIAKNATDQIVSTAANQAAITATDILTMTDIRKAVRTLMNNKAMKWGDGYYVLIVNPFTAYDIQSDQTWVDSGKYREGTDHLFTGEIGKWFGTRVIQTTQPHRSSVNNDTYAAAGAVHHNLICGREAYGVTKLNGAEKKVIVKNSGPQDTGNPLSLYGTCGWYCAYVPKTLNSNFILNIKTGATA
jgi:N4-gp56 family major capsid protein